MIKRVVRGGSSDCGEDCDVYDKDDYYKEDDDYDDDDDDEEEDDDD